MIAIVDYGLGNPLSIKNMLNRLGHDSLITQDYSSLNHAQKIILPGVGHFNKGIENLKKSGLDIVLSDLVLNKKKPILGICLGLSWIDAETVKFISQSNEMKIPHMGWADTSFKNSFIEDHDFIENPPRFYHVHSYYVKCKYESEVMCKTQYFNQSFDSGFIKGNIMGVQFHPEKSHIFGKRFLSQFVNWNP
jgi:glutamine amidotransferase